MKFAVSDDERLLRLAVSGTIGRSLEGQAGSDAATGVLEALYAAGYLDVLRSESALSAAIVVEEAIAANVDAHIAARAIVAPAILHEIGALSIALADATRPMAPVRYGAQADLVLVATDNKVLVVKKKDLSLLEVPSHFIYPYARFHDLQGAALGPGSSDKLRDWWRLALAVEMASLMRSAIRDTLAYVAERSVFGKTLSAYQSVRHRMSEHFVHAEAATWLARQAAWTAADGSAGAGASAAAYAAEVAKAVIDDCHQFHGAMGLAREHPLHLSTLRLHALRLELGGADSHRWALGVSELLRLASHAPSSGITQRAERAPQSGREQGHEQSAPS